MSFNLGNWWEKLNQDILRGGGSGDDDSGSDSTPDLDLPDDYHDPSWDDPDPFGLSDPTPDPSDEGSDPYWSNDRGPEFNWPFDWP